MNWGWKYIRESHGDLYGVGWDRAQEKADDAIKAPHQALAEPPNSTTDVVEPVAWHEPGAYGNVTTHKDWALANDWKPLYKERT